MTQHDKKRAVARAALDWVESDSVVGVGTGSTADCFTDLLPEVRQRVRATVATSLATERRLRGHGFAVIDLEEAGRLPIYVDGADEATASGMLIKGGGGALTREKIVASASDRFVCIVDESKLVDRLGAFALPIEIIPLAAPVVARALGALGGRPVPRAGFVTDNGNAILDVHDLVIDEPARLESEINQIPGVVTNGLFCLRGADTLLVAGASSVTTYP